MDKETEVKETEVKETEVKETKASETLESKEMLDMQGLADLISEKDKANEELRTEINKLKKANADMLIRISAAQEPAKGIEETIIDFCDTRKVK